MTQVAELFDIRTEQDALVVTPQKDLGELVFEKFEAGFGEITSQVREVRPRVVVVDLSHTKTCGSTALGYLQKLNRTLQETGGRMIVCGLSEFEREVVAATQLDTQWQITESREEALSSAC